MKHFNLRLTALAVVAAAGLSSSIAYAAESALDSQSRVAKMRQTAKPVRPFRGQKPWDVQTAQFNAARPDGTLRKTAATAPAVQFEALSAYDYLEAPDGTVWMYTTEYEMETIEHNEYWTEEFILAYTFTIYDSSFNKVGTIKDKITLAAGETKVAHAVLDPALSAHFFNTDDNYEVMVYLAMNTGPEHDYEVHYYNKVYSIGGEKDAEGNDVCIAMMPGRCVDVFNAAAGTGTEDYYYTFVDDIYPNLDDFGFDQFLDYLNAAKTQVSVYGKGSLTPIFQKDIYLTRYPGDTTDGIYMITKAVGGTPYFIFSQYEKPYFVDPTGFASDESATPDNSLVIETYAIGGNSQTNLLSTTKIPVEIEEKMGEINYTFYSIGSVAWKDDIDMSVNGTPQAPAFLVARDYTKASNLEEVASSYDIYGNDGQLKHHLAANSDGISVLGSIDGQQPQALFVSKTGEGDETQYTFNFIDLYSGTTILSLPQAFGGDPITASCQRVATATGDYQYVFEMRYWATDEEGNDYHRMAWVNKDGSLARIDSVKLGKNCMAAAVNMYPECLSPFLFDMDPAMEYAVLVKRMDSETTKNEFIVVDDNGEPYALFSEADGKGSPMMFTILPGTDKNRLQMVYITEADTYNVDIYDLPFESDKTAIDGNTAASASPITLNGTTLVAHGATIEVYTPSGVKVQSGQNTVSLQSLPHAIYIAVARYPQGNISTLKIAL